jgi:ABC-2 type transport system permease protein
MGMRVYSILLKEFLQGLRDPKMRGVIFIAPIVQLLLFGYAVSTDVRQVPTAVYDLDQTPQSRDLLSRFFASGTFQQKERITRAQQVPDLMDLGKVSAVLQINRGFAETLESRRKAPVQLIVDGTDSNTAMVTISYASRILRDYNQRLEVEALGLPEGTSLTRGVDLQDRAWFNINLESRMFYLPGVIALIGMLITLMLTSMAIVREREVGTMEQLMVTPIRPVELILGKLLPFALIALFDMTLITTVAVFWFGIPIQGSLLLLFVSMLLFLLPSLGIGLFISTISATQQQAMMTTFLFFFPANLLSGFAFPIDSMPEVVQWITYFNPLRYFLVIIRGIFLKGSEAGILWPQMVALGVLGSFTLTLSALRFTKRLK